MGMEGGLLIGVFMGGLSAKSVWGRDRGVRLFIFNRVSLHALERSSSMRDWLQMEWNS